LELVANRKAIHPRKLNGEQDEIGDVGRSRRNALLAVIHNRGLAPVIRKTGSQELSKFGVALEKEHLRRHASMLTLRFVTGLVRSDSLRQSPGGHSGQGQS